MTDLIPPTIAKTAEGKFLKLEANEPQQFVLSKSIELVDAQDGDNLKFFRKVTIEGVERHIKYIIHLREMETGDTKEWSIGSAGVVNQLQTLKASVGDVIEVEKIQTGSRPQDIRYRIKMVQKMDSNAPQTPPPPAKATKVDDNTPPDDSFDPEDIPQ